ncbi:MAG: hypothetical protein HYY96_15865 [Candidatus Tectomicrobia bacterium]|nr:hypothetical protein [Candidatus Tectomicrobia bacterium]
MKAAAVDEVMRGFKEAGINFAAFLPDGWLWNVAERVMADPDFIHVPVVNEAVGVAACAGAWLGGKRPVMLTEASGMMVACDALSRLSLFGTPFLLCISHRGTLGDPFYWSVAMGWSTEPVIQALRLQYRKVERSADIRRSIVEAQTSLTLSKAPVALLFSGEAVR